MLPRTRTTESVPGTWHSLCELSGLDEPARRRLWRGLSACPDGPAQALRLAFVRLDHAADIADCYRRFLSNVHPVSFCETLERIVTTRADLRASVSVLQEFVLGMTDHRGQWRYEPLDLTMPGGTSP